MSQIHTMKTWLATEGSPKSRCVRACAVWCGTVRCGAGRGTARHGVAWRACVGAVRCVRTCVALRACMCTCAHVCACVLVCLRAHVYVRAHLHTCVRLGGRLRMQYPIPVYHLSNFTTCLARWMAALTLLVLLLQCGVGTTCYRFMETRNTHIKFSKS